MASTFASILPELTIEGRVFFFRGIRHGHLRNKKVVIRPDTAEGWNYPIRIILVHGSVYGQGTLGWVGDAPSGL